jgi:hypothetical protein
LSTEVSNRIADVNAEESRAMSAELVLTNDLSTEVSNRGTAINNEASIRLAADQSLASAVSVEQGRIDAILDGSEVDLDQFAEIVEFVNGIDLENDNALLSAVTSIGLEINNEADARAYADASLESDLSSEANARQDADATLSTNLSTEVSNRGTAINNEADARVSADNSLAAGLSAEISTRTSADNSLEVALSAEIVRAENAETSLEAELSTQVSYLISNTDLTETDSFTEVVDQINNAFETTNNQLVSYTTGLMPQLSFLNESPNGILTTFTAMGLVDSTAMVFINGLLQMVGQDCTITNIDDVTTIEFLNEAPSATDRLYIYGVSLDASNGRPTAPQI